MNGKYFFVCVLMTLSVKVFPQSMCIDDAIGITASEMGKRLERNNRVAVLNFSSNWQELSSYVIDELNNTIVRNGSLTVVNRQELDLVRREQNFQMSGEVDDKSAQSIGKFLGAQSVLSGSFTPIGNTYRFRIRVIAVETGVVQYSNSINIEKDSILTSLMPKPEKDYEGLKKIGRNLGYGFLNPLLGLGSWLQGDYAWGGGPLTFAYLISIIPISIEFTSYDYWADGAGVCGTIGFGIVSAALLYGFIRPFVFSHINGLAQVPDGFYMAVVPVASGGVGMNIGYSVKF